MSNKGAASKQKAKKNQKHLNACQPAALSTACDPETYERSPSPYDNTMAEDDSVAVTRTGGPPSDQYMMGTAVSWDGGNAYCNSREYVGQQPSHQQQPMKCESPYYQVSQTGTQGGSNVVTRQPGPNEPMHYGNYRRDGSGGQSVLGQQHVNPQYQSQQHGYHQRNYQEYGHQDDHQQSGYYGGGGGSV